MRTQANFRYAVSSQAIPSDLRCDLRELVLAATLL